MRLLSDGYYPAPPGGRLEGVATHAGPASYVEIVVASPPTGGDTLNANEFGLKFFDSVEVLGCSDDGQFSAYPVWNKGIRSRPSSVKLLWFTADGGVEVVATTNLSARSLRIRVTGE